ncbi:hypothetical protein AC96_0742 [Escherichia coli 2-156-04_S4_C2]|nr:hypothetical protein AC96_0742 [Escherichia coli 2-156-04_S4_C2]
MCFFPIGKLTHYRSNTFHYGYNNCWFCIKKNDDFFHNFTVMSLTEIVGSAYKKGSIRSLKFIF